MYYVRPSRYETRDCKSQDNGYGSRDPNPLVRLVQHVERNFLHLRYALLQHQKLEQRRVFRVYHSQQLVHRYRLLGLHGSVLPQYHEPDVLLCYVLRNLVVDRYLYFLPETPVRIFVYEELVYLALDEIILCLVRLQYHLNLLVIGRNVGTGQRILWLRRPKMPELPDNARDVRFQVTAVKAVLRFK